MMTLACIVGARPNFVKMAPLLRALDAHDGVRATLVHTGQHYDKSLSDVFFADLEMRRPDVSLHVGSGSHGEQTAKIIQRMERLLLDEPVDRVVVVGDVDSTLGAALTAVKLGIPVAHVEAGLRSFDRTMPEEINRVVTDSVADMLFVSEPAGVDNLRREGHSATNIHLVGNTMIDSLLRLLPRARQLDTASRLGLAPGSYGVLTLHRPANVDDPDVLSGLLAAFVEISKTVPLVFPIHPRTKRRIDDFGFGDQLADVPGILALPPCGYLEFLSVTCQARFIVTDSGGLQEESTALGIPCLTMRENTERPITVDRGSNTLIGHDTDKLNASIGKVLDGAYKCGSPPKLWDGQAAQRIASILVDAPPNPPHRSV